MHAALVYLTTRSLRNSAALRLGRLRQPRYLVIAVGGALYFGVMIVNRSHAGGFTVPTEYEGIARATTALFIAAALSLTWLLPSGAALRFTRSDVQFLFPAPLSRREILAYKIGRLLFGAAAMALPLTLIIGPVRVLPAVLFYIKVAAISGVVALHEAGVSLYRVHVRNSGGLEGQRRIAIIGANVAIVAVTVWILTTFAFAATLGQLLPFGVLVVLAMTVQIAWILGTDAAFEEDAAAMSEKAHAWLAGAGRRQPASARKPQTSASLAPHGSIEIAILWKNWHLLTRTSGTRWIAIVSITAVVTAAGAAFAFADGDPAAAFIGFMLAAVATFLGPVMLRVDLRQDLAHLGVIKTWPVRGATIIRGEVLVPAIALISAATVGTTLAVLLAPDAMVPSGATLAWRLVLLCVAVPALSAVIVTQLVIQNGIAALFPAWVRITPGTVQPAGMEMMGQWMVVSYGGLFVLLLAAVVPGASAAALAFMTDAILAPVGLFAVLLLIEGYAATEIIGRVLDRTDLQDVVVTE